MKHFVLLFMFYVEVLIRFCKHATLIISVKNKIKLQFSLPQYVLHVLFITQLYILVHCSFFFLLLLLPITYILLKQKIKTPFKCENTS